MSRSLDMMAIRLILKYAERGFSQRDIAKAARCSRNTVASVLIRATRLKMTFQKALNLSDKDLRNTFYPTIDPMKDVPEPDVEYIVQELKNKHVTLTMLHEEYLDQNPNGLKYTQFCERIRTYIDTRKITMHIERKAGERMEIDWSGDAVYYRDPITGDRVRCYVLVVVLGRSGYPYAEAFQERNQTNYITGIVHALHYYGGAPRMFVPDNDKSAVIKHRKYEIVLNRMFEEMADYYGVAVIPTRVRHPKDKASVEKTVFDLAERELLGRGRNETFHAVSDINAYLRKIMKSFSDKPFQKKNGSRYSQFREEDFPQLKALPSKPYEVRVHKFAKVHPDYHVDFERILYSTPYNYAHREVEIIASIHLIEIWCDHVKIASHCRNYDLKKRYVTEESHMPKEHQAMKGMSKEYFEKWAEKTSPDTLRLVNEIFAGRRIEEQGYRACLGLMSLAKKNVSCFKQAVECVVQNHAYSYKVVAEFFKTFESRLVECPVKNSNVRGPEYYGGVHKC
jgi:transposase